MEDGRQREREREEIDQDDRPSAKFGCSVQELVCFPPPTRSGGRVAFVPHSSAVTVSEFAGTRKGRPGSEGGACWSHDLSTSSQGGGMAYRGRFFGDARNRRYTRPWNRDRRGSHHPTISQGEALRSPDVYTNGHMKTFLPQ